MAGHSKWANIRFRKGVQDAKRGKVFTKLIREITIAARVGGGDVSHNPRLRLAIDRALGQNMPKDNIERAIKRGTGELEGAHYEEIQYEGYGPAGAAVLVACTTDNRNRTAGEVRHAFSKHGGNLGTEGSVAYLFEKRGVLMFPDGDEEALLEAALDAGADDIAAVPGEGIEVLTAPDKVMSVREGLVQRGLTPSSAETVIRPLTDVALAGEDAERVMKLLEALEDLDDVQTVYTNAAFMEESA
ncbi:YebC/PmpR family DNA-binding transcriptional regulator [Acidiferrobacter sp. SPIII_3]|jgi:YebC/PmpR family DNA-binding regulatory protein|uniref:YebC/PmpR family DNA-binding transcriptional regulator n=1 Tax=Acidiferrobacter sp. SPIII_3 TaxID=1281578 RepID=UPI000D72960B|nr:YebC/PmpR family DNA-binding transcriptional regulator [Acidiferrobacter sp. SPIII_3]AWP24270.1 YebC/PmpR family DNA-binding transcriptional regulator [Acidiferrobacter sp. SPIII_3]